VPDTSKLPSRLRHHDEKRPNSGQQEACPAITTGSERVNTAG